MVAVDGAGGDEAGTGDEHRKGAKGDECLSRPAHGPDEPCIPLLCCPKTAAARGHLRSAGVATAEGDELPKALDAVHQVSVDPTVVTADRGGDRIDTAPAEERKRRH